MRNSSFVLSVTATAIACFTGWQYSAERNEHISTRAELETVRHELAAARREIAELNKPRPAPPGVAPEPVGTAPRAAAAPLVATAHAEPAPSPAAPPSGHQPAPDETQVPIIANARVSAVGRFVQLTDAQRARLTEKFTREAQGESGTESLETIIGEENAAFYRNQVSRAFERAREESLEKEVLYLSRRLSMNSEQEKAVWNAIRDAEKNVSEELRVRTFKGKLDRMLAEERLKQERTAEALRSILSPEQYQAYLRDLSESSATDFTSLHGD